MHRFEALAKNDAEVRGLCSLLLEQWRGIEFLGFDIYGHPIIREDASQSIELFDDDSIALETILAGRAYATQVMQALKFLYSTTGKKKTVLKHVYLVDLSGVRFRQLTARVRSRFRFVVQTLEKVYPDVIYRTYVVNAPKSLSYIWGAISALLHPQTRAKIRILPAGVDIEKSGLLLDGIPASNFPKCLGGTADALSLVDIFDADDSNTVSIGSPLKTLRSFHSTARRPRSLIFKDGLPQPLASSDSQDQRRRRLLLCLLLLTLVVVIFFVGLR